MLNAKSHSDAADVVIDNWMKNWVMRKLIWILYLAARIVSPIIQINVSQSAEKPSKTFQFPSNNWNILREAET